MPRTVEQIEITAEELRLYIRQLHIQRQSPMRSEALNLNQFIKERRGLVDDDLVVHQINLGRVQAEDGELFDLAGGDLSFVNFGESDFKQEHWVLGGFKQDGVVKQITNLQGVTLPKECKFHGLSFDGSDWGKRVIAYEQFEQCSFKGANYDPTHPIVEGLSTQLITKVKVSETQLKAYLDALHSDPIPEHARGSLADFLEYELLPYCSENTKIVPDLSGLEIDGNKFDLDGANFSGSILSELKVDELGVLDNQSVRFINVKATHLTMRDCVGSGAVFEECDIGNLDLRGSESANMYFGSVTYPIGFREGSKEVAKKATKIANIIVTAMTDNLQEYCEAYVEDQCYVRRQSSLSVNEDGEVVAREIQPQTYHDCTREDIEAFAAARYGSRGKSFREFLRERHGIEDEEFIPYAKGVDLDSLDLSNCNWGRCCFDSCSMVRTSWEGSILEGSYFGNCNFTGESEGVFFGNGFRTSFRSAKLKDAIFDQARGEYADFSYADMDLVSAISADFSHGVFVHAQARMATFSGATMTSARADHMDITGSDVSSCTFVRIRMRHGVADHVNADGTDFDQSDIAGISLQYSSANRASMVGVNADGANMTGTRLWANIDKIKLRAMKFDLVCSTPPEDSKEMKDKTIYLFVSGHPPKLQYKAKDHKGDVIIGDFDNENPGLLQRYVTGNRFEKITNKLVEGRKLSSGDIELVLATTAKRGLQVAAVFNVDASGAQYSQGLFGGSPRIDRFTKIDGMMDSALKYELEVDQAIIKSIPTIFEDIYFVAKSLDAALKMTSLAKFAKCTKAVQVAGRLFEDKWVAGACLAGTPMAAFAVMGWLTAAIDITGGAASLIVMSALSPLVVAAGVVAGGMIAMKLLGVGEEPKEVAAAKERQASYAKLHQSDAPELGQKRDRAAFGQLQQQQPGQFVARENERTQARGKGKSIDGG